MVKQLLTPVSVGVIAIASFLTYFTYPPNGYITLANLGWMAGPLSIIELPSMALGIMVSGNVHQPNPVATCIGLFSTYLLLVGGITMLAIVIRKRIKSTQSKGPI